MSIISPKLVIDAGHWDRDDGAKYNNLTESHLTKQVRNELYDLLKDRKVLYVPDGLDLKQTLEWINKQVDKNDLAISIHFNSNKDPFYQGTEAYYSDDPRLAHIFAEQVSKSLGTVNRGARHDSLTYVGSLGFLRQLKCQSVVVECLYMTNKLDRRILEDGGVQKAAQGIVNACNILNPNNELEILKELQRRVAILWELFYKLIGLKK